MKTSGFITFCYLLSQSIELLCRSLGRGPCASQLSLANRMHHFHPRNRTPGRPEGLEAQHRANNPVDRTMILLHEVIEILALSDSDAGRVDPVVPLNRRGVAGTLVDGD